MDGVKVIQQLLRPTDTCVIVAQGYLLGVQPPAHQLFAVVKHEGSEEHALFLFEVDTMESPPRFTLEQFFAIRGSFNAQAQMNHGAQCQILVDNGEGSSLMLQLPYDTHTAIFLSQLEKALHNFTQSSSANSRTAFKWLQGYEKCRSGWDRFTKPGHSHNGENSSQLINFSGESAKPLGLAFPETWPWSHIITPSSDGTTVIAPCEAMLEDFDPLHNKNGDDASQSDPDQPLQQPVGLSVTGATPENSPLLSAPANPFSADPPTRNPFSSPSPPLRNPSLPEQQEMRHCISDSNLLALQSEHRFHSLNHFEPLVTRSEVDLLTSLGGQEERHCVAGDPDHCLLNETEQCLLEQSGTARSGDMGREEVNREELEDTVDKQSNRSQIKSFSLNTPNLRVQSAAEVQHSSSEEDLLDYKNRRVKSTETSPTDGRNRKLTKESIVQFRSRSGPRPLVSKVNMTSPVLSRKRASSWVSRYRPGVPVPTLSARESIVQAELRQKEKEFCEFEVLRVFCGTWNVNGRWPPSTIEQFLLEYKTEREKTTQAPDIYAIAFQELDLSTQCLMGQESNREEPWVCTVETTLQKAGKYKRLCCVRLVGILLLVYIKFPLFGFVSDVETETVMTGMLGLMGNKGAVAVHFNLYHSSLCFVNGHLPAHAEELEKRNQDYHTIMSKMTFSKSDFAYGILDHDMVFWLGDLNYRIQVSPEMTAEQVKALADNYQLPTLLKYDQLLQEMAKKTVFLGFTEGHITFKPTYKYNVNSDEWDSEKHRAPSWCDRVLYRGKHLQQQSYCSHPALKISDHKPVSSVFDTTVRKVNSQKERAVLERITWQLDKLENDTLPQVDLNVTEFMFKDIKFKEPQLKELVVTNMGQRPVHISFICKPNDEAYCKPWIVIKPSSAVIQPLKDLVMTVCVYVDEDTAPVLTSHKEQFDDILVLHLEKGKDFFIAVNGNYLPSCFGSSLEALIHMHTYIREVPVAQLVDLSSSWEMCTLSQSSSVVELKETPPPLDIPKELFQLVDRIKRYGLETEDLFTDGGRQAELQDIQDVLDRGGKELPGTVFSAAAALLTFLSALAEPVVPTSLHARAMEGNNNLTLCKQVLVQMPPVHKRTFRFLVTFMKELLEHSEVNGLDPKVLAAIFGEVLLRTPASERKTKSKRALNAMNRKKAAFIYQFLVNDLATPYR